MKSFVILAALGCLGAQSAQASVSTSVFSSNRADGLSADGEYITSLGDIEGSRNDDGQASSYSGHSPAEVADVYGMAFSTNGTSQASGVTAEADVDWMPPSPDITRTRFSGWTNSTLYDSQRADLAGRVRFTLRYELFSSGVGAASFINLLTSASTLKGTGVDTVGDQFELYARDGQHLTGVWVSDWFDFDAGDPLLASDPTAWSYGHGLYGGVSIDSDSVADLPANGSLNAYSRATISLEVAPVPEPETFVLMGAGLIAAGFAARRRVRI